MSQYYFTVASLPHLTYEMEKVPAREEFMITCEENLSPKDLELLKTAIIDDLEPKEVSFGILKNWYIWERNLRNRLLQFRAKKKGVEPDEFVRENPELLLGHKVSREAFEADSPLHAEDILNYKRWNYLEELELGHYFDSEKLVIYYLKLQLLWRKESFNKEKGKENFNEIIEKISNEDLYNTGKVEGQ